MFAVPTDIGETQLGGGGGLRLIKQMAMRRFGKAKVDDAMEAMKRRPVMKINRPPQPGRFMKVSDGAKTAMEKMVM